ncbi:M64 family metallopeptidase [Dokdonella sp.]|uniref:M64 family metallopeptidase n=1 Tax=Dokdonella sp. TaxID=2291710 RepID=UPI001B07C797|nr:M64 family metallopeptidase [Dokdonella sp.]MBO9662513.1 hypothetical protein [Dokdonella sp.]
MKPKFRWTWLAAIAASNAAWAAPAHYVVFEMDAAKNVRALFYTQVDIADAALERARDAQPAGEERIAYRLVRDGVGRGERSVEVPSLRAEFARDPDRGDQRIVARPVDAAVRHFVLRVPLADADTVEFGDAGKTQRFDLHELASREQTTTYAGRTPMQIERAPNAGNPANRVDMLVIGEGYTAAQQGLFDSDAAILRESFFGLTPYKEYQSFVNWTTGFVASNQSGADHPPYQSGCTQATCCSDPEAQSDPRAGQFVDTAFDATFCAFQIHRLLTVDDGAVLAAAAAYPDWDKIVVVVNDPVYGGAGGNISTTSTHAQATQIVLHEYGHSFTGLADEYDSPYPGFPPCSDLSGGAPCEANVTDQTSASSVKWKSWFTPGNPIPTPPGTSGVGLFEGARYRSSGMFRPVDTQCLMQFLGVPFCPVCAQEYVRTLYRGGFGVPAGGIDLIEPGSESPPTSGVVAYGLGSSRTFQVSTLQPTIGSIAVQWYLDGAAISGANAASYVFSQGSPTPATRTLEVRVTDSTALVSPTMAGGLLEHRRSWTIQVGNDVIFRNGFESP